MPQKFTPPSYAVKQEDDEPIEAKTFTPPDYVDKPKEPEEKKGLLSRAWDYVNAPMTDLPSRMTAKPAESLMSYGESGDDLLHKAALWGGGFLKEIGDTATSMTSPMNAALTVATEGSNLAYGRGLNSIGKVLETPGRLAGAGMVGHGTYKVLDADNSPDRLAGIAEAALGLLGTRARAEPHTGMPNSGPKIEAPINEPRIKTPNVSVKGPENKARPGYENIYDGEGRFLSEEPIAQSRPSVFDVNKSIETGKGVEFTPPDYVAKDIPNIRPETETSIARRETIDNFEKESSAPLEAPPTETPQVTAEFSSHDANGKPVFHLKGGDFDGSDVTGVEALNKLGVAIPENIPEPVISKLPPAIKAMLDEAGIDSSQMDVTTAVNKARELRGQKSTASEIPPAAPIENQEAVASPIDKLKGAIQQSSANRTNQDLINSQERAIRAARMEGVTTPGIAGHYERSAALKGEYPNLPVESQLTQVDVDGLADHINMSGLKTYDKFNATNGLIKLLSGKTIPPYQAKLLGRVFGEDMEELIHLHGGLGAPGGVGSIINNTVNLPKTMMSTLDLSAPFRQGLGLIHRKEYWSAFHDMFKYAGNTRTYEALQQTIHDRPNFELGHKAGLYLADVGAVLEGREEQFLSHYAEKIPVFGRLTKGSERAYTGFLNKLRSDTFDNMLAQAQKAGHKLEEVKKVLKDGTEVKGPTKIVDDIAEYVNNATGRGSLGRFEKNATDLNMVLFSPRLIASRMHFLNPMTYIDPNTSSMVRKEALKSLFAIAGLGVTVGALSKAAGAKVSGDITSTDFGKARFGRTTLDPFGGFQQPIVAAARLISGESTSTSGKTTDLTTSKFPNPTRATVAGNFARSKESPLASFIDAMAQGAQAFPPGGLGQQIGTNRPSAEIINRFTPMLVNDLIDLSKSDPDLLPLAIPAALGMGLQTDDEKKPTSHFNLGFKKLKP